jgi:hypothetical protein
MREHIYKAIAQKQVLAGQKKKEKFTTTAAHYMLVKPQLPAASFLFYKQKWPTVLLNCRPFFISAILSSECIAFI